MQYPHVLVAVVLLFFLFIGSKLFKSDAPKTAQKYLKEKGILVPLRSDIGSSHMPVFCSAHAQRYFDQGLRFVVAYQFRLSLENFLQCQLLSPDCSMCYWGEALSRGQNLNDIFDDSTDNIRRAWEAVEMAKKINSHSKGATEHENALIAKEAMIIHALELR